MVSDHQWMLNQSVGDVQSAKKPPKRVQLTLPGGTPVARQRSAISAGYERSAGECWWERTGRGAQANEGHEPKQSSALWGDLGNVRAEGRQSVWQAVRLRERQVGFEHSPWEPADIFIKEGNVSELFPYERNIYGLTVISWGSVSQRNTLPTPQKPRGDWRESQVCDILGAFRKKGTLNNKGIQSACQCALR